ncbi:MAG: hypothetical protein L3J63_06060 [Geopsychrobacter sp.]|nr:hypothetical protein [Geopsychrobacter sp.]
MKNKLIRLAELIQEGFPENIKAAFRSTDKSSLKARLAITSDAISFHQRHSETLWLEAGKKRSPAERRAAAKSELAGFLFAYLTGDAKESAQSAIEALHTLGRQGEIELISSLVKR